MTILPQLEHDLFQAAKQRLPAADMPDETHDHWRHVELESTGGWADFRHRLATTATTLPMVLPIVVTVIIAALALTLIHHGRQPPLAKPASGVQATRQELIQTLGVLRRPQTQADLAPELYPGFLVTASIAERFARRHRRPPPGLERRLAQMGYPRLDRSLMRVVSIPAWHAKVGIQPAIWRPSRSSPQRSEGLSLELWIGAKPTIPPSREDGTGPQLTSIKTIRAHGLALADDVNGKNLLDGVLLVPDGVARITLGLTRIIQSPVNVNPSQFGTTTATVHNNIAAFRLAIPTVTGRGWVTGMFGTSAVAQTTWFDAGGNVIKQTTTTLDVFIKVRGHNVAAPPPATLTRR